MQACAMNDLSVSSHESGISAPRSSDGASLRGHDASLNTLLAEQRRDIAEEVQSARFSDGDAELLPLILSLARLAARADVLAAI